MVGRVDGGVDGGDAAGQIKVEGGFKIVVRFQAVRRKRGVRRDDRQGVLRVDGAVISRDFNLVRARSQVLEADFLEIVSASGFPSHDGPVLIVENHIQITGSIVEVDPDLVAFMANASGIEAEPVAIAGGVDRQVGQNPSTFNVAQLIGRRGGIVARAAFCPIAGGVALGRRAEFQAVVGVGRAFDAGDPNVIAPLCETRQADLLAVAAAVGEFDQVFLVLGFGGIGGGIEGFEKFKFQITLGVVEVNADELPVSAVAAELEFEPVLVARRIYGQIWHRQTGCLRSQQFSQTSVGHRVDTCLLYTSRCV